MEIMLVHNFLTWQHSHSLTVIPAVDQAVASGTKEPLSQAVKAIDNTSIAINLCIESQHVEVSLRQVTALLPHSTTVHYT